MRIYLKIKDSRLSIQKTVWEGAEDIFLLNFSNSIYKRILLLLPLDNVESLFKYWAKLSTLSASKDGYAMQENNEECVTELEVSEMKRWTTQDSVKNLILAELIFKKSCAVMQPYQVLPSPLISCRPLRANRAVRRLVACVCKRSKV